MPLNDGENAQNDPDRQGVLVVGCGYLGGRVAKAVKLSGQRVWATTRSQQRASELSESGFEPIVLDWTNRQTLQSIPQVSKVLVAVSYDRSSEVSRHDSQVGGLQNLLDKIAPAANVCYISTTGVFHQTDGQWVDEDSPATPTREGGRAHLDAETALGRCRGDKPWSILRLSGIYGPDRVPRAKDVMNGRPICSPESGYLNLIHVDDAVACCVGQLGVSASATVPGFGRRASCARRFLSRDREPVWSGFAHVRTTRSLDAPVSMRSNSNKRI